MPCSCWTRSEAVELVRWPQARPADSTEPIDFLCDNILFSKLGMLPEEIRMIPTCSASDENLTGTPSILIGFISLA